MIYRLKEFFGRKARDESGTASVEFVLVFPAYLSLIIMSVELGFVTMRHTLIERGMDIAVRELRLGTGTVPQHEQIKDIVCANALMVADCATNLRLEMSPASMFNFQSLDTTPDCTDAADEAKPVREFTAGIANDIMLLRACYKFEPLFPDGFLGNALTKDVHGESAIVSMTAFVQEPN